MHVVSCKRVKCNSTHATFTLQDDSDMQYRGFRDNIFLLTAVTTASVVLKNIFLRVVHLNNSSSRPSHSIPFLLGFSAVFLLGLHGTSLFKILGILSVNYILARACAGSKLGPVFTWAFNMIVLFSNEWNDGYRFSTIHPALGFMVRS